MKCFAQHRQRDPESPHPYFAPSHSTGTWSHWSGLPGIYHGSKLAPYADQPASAQLNWGDMPTYELYIYEKVTTSPVAEYIPG